MVLVACPAPTDRQAIALQDEWESVAKELPGMSGRSRGFMPPRGALWNWGAWQDKRAATEMERAWDSGAGTGGDAEVAKVL